MTTAALVIGLCSHGLSVTRALRDAQVDVYALEQDLAIPGSLTNSVKRVFEVADFSTEQLIPILVNIRQQLAQYDKVVLIPTNDNHVRQVGKGFAQLEGHYLLSWSACIEAIMRLQKKSELEQIARAHGLNYPKSAVITALGAAAAAVEGFRYPIIIKPVQPLSSFKTQLAASLPELLGLLQQFRADLPILAQEYIAGGDESLYFGALVLDRGKRVQGMVGRKLSSFPPARGQTTVAEVTDEPQVLALTEQFFDGFALSGPVSLELKKAPDGSFWVIEPTVGRTDFWAELCVAAGFNQPYQEFLIAQGLPVQPQALAGDVAWYDAERSPTAYWRAVWQYKSLRPYGKRPVFTFFRLADQRPFWRAFGQLGARLRRKLL
jgi:predicted ATP-grasp superfamily ATP-dependent carboligase